MRSRLVLVEVAMCRRIVQKDSKLIKNVGVNRGSVLRTQVDGADNV
jgi:hypothetical protein